MRLTPASLAACAGWPGIALAGWRPAMKSASIPLRGGSGTLLYPGGQYMRVVRPLLQPGEPRDGANSASYAQASPPARTRRPFGKPRAEAESALCPGGCRCAASSPSPRRRARRCGDRARRVATGLILMRHPGFGMTWRGRLLERMCAAAPPPRPAAKPPQQMAKAAPPAVPRPPAPERSRRA